MNKEENEEKQKKNERKKEYFVIKTEENCNLLEN